jgi:hypothetical protein
MLQEGVEWFGDLSDNVGVTVALPEPAECETIRANIASGREEIAGLQGALEGLDPTDRADRNEIRAIYQQISALEREIAGHQQRANELGCR